MKISRSDIILIALVALVAWNVRGCFIPVHKPESMIRNEERIKYLEHQRLNDSITGIRHIQAIDSLIALSIQKTQATQVQYQKVKTIYEKIPVVVGNYDREQLRVAITNY